ncbi:MAG: VanZ family protein [Pseudomonadota bacterium]
MQSIALVWIARICLVASAVLTIMATLDPMGRDIRIEMYKEADKIAHFMATFLVSLFALIAFPRIQGSKIFFAVAMAAIALELAQLLSPRSAELTDLLMSWLGVMVIALTFYAKDIRSVIFRIENGG